MGAGYGVIIVQHHPVVHATAHRYFLAQRHLKVPLRALNVRQTKHDVLVPVHQAHGIAATSGLDEFCTAVSGIVALLCLGRHRLDTLCFRFLPQQHKDHHADSRQHRRAYRESLDCAVALQELQAMGISNIVTFDAHDPRMQNAVPLMGFDNVMPTYQVLKAMLRAVPDLQLDRDHFMVISPDEGAMNRNMYYASVLGVNLGMFYKRRDYSQVVNGRNPIVAHEYLGESVEGKDVFVADDIISSGESMLDIAYALKKQGAKRIFANATYAIFTNGLDSFDKAYADGMIAGVFGSNLTYRTPELLSRPWFHEVDVSKYIAYFIAALNHDLSVSAIIDPHEKIKALLERTGQAR